ncbi:MAG: hypothetical protein ACLGGX_11525 [Bdellovibrionia bacterium]
MKKLVIIAAVLFSAQAQASLSCSQLVSYKAQLQNELAQIRSEIRQARNSDKIEFLMDEYELVFSKLQNIEKAIDSDCK